MTRIYVHESSYHDYDPDPCYQEPRSSAGYFTEEAAIYWHGDKGVFDGSNLADVNTRDQHRGQGLYRTAQGRWVLRTWSNWQREPDTHTYIDPSDAKNWLVFNDHDDAANKHFGVVEDERGPGRPEIGNAISLRLGELLGPLDAYASARGISRAEAVREAVKVLVSAHADA